MSSSTDNFFGGILDGIRTTATDFNSFTGGNLGTDIAKGIAGGAKPQNNFNKLWEANHLASMNQVNDKHSPYERGYAPQGNVDKTTEGKFTDFSSVEQSWLMRMRRFSQIDSEMSVGKINEGPDR